MYNISMEKHRNKRWLLVAAIALLLYLSVGCVRSVGYVLSIPDGITITRYGVDRGMFGAVDCRLDVEESDAEVANGKLSFKLFGLLPLKTVDILCAKDKQVRLGGFPIGLVMNLDGVLVDEIGYVETAAGKVAIGGGIEAGDLILNLDNTKITSSKDITDFMENYKSGDKIKVTLRRGGKILQVSVSPLIDELSGKYRLGLWVQDTVSGVGTTSFIKSDNTFASLGHGIAVNDSVLPVCGGKAYNCEIAGINKGFKGTPGELKGVLKHTDNPIGEIYKNTDYGVYGHFNSNADIPEKYYHIGSRINVRNGKAKIYTTVSGCADFYDVEIIRAMPQSERADRSMVIRVTDKRLLDISGGIVRGMSGSPIIQNDMIIGALTHVFVNDPTKGYGLYLDWMY